MQGFHSLLTLVVLKLQKIVRANVTVLSMEVLLSVFCNIKCKQFGQYLQFSKAIAQWQSLEIHSQIIKSQCVIPLRNYK